MKKNYPESVSRESNYSDVMVIIDDMEIQHIIENISKKHGLTTRCFKKGQSAFKATKKNLPAIILISTILPDTNAFDLCRKLKSGSKTKDVPVLFLAEPADLNKMEKGFEAGGEDFISIPIQADELIIRIKKHILHNTNSSVDENSLAEKFNFQTDLLNALEESVIVTKPDGVVTYWNTFAEKLYGWKAKEVIGRNIMEINVPQMAYEQATAIMENVQAGNSWSGEFQVQRCDGKTFPIFVTNTPIYNDEKEMIAIVGVSIDITERKRAEEEIAKQQKLANNYLNIVGNIILALNPEGEITLLNQRGYDIFGYENGELIGKDYFSVCLPTEIGGEIKAHFKELLRCQTKYLSYRINFD